MNKLLTLGLASLFSFTALTPQTKIQIDKNLFDLKNNYIQTELQNENGLNDYLNTTGKIRLGTRQNSIFLNRDGTLNYTFGSNLDINGFSNFYIQKRENIKIQNRNSIGNINIISNTLNLSRDKEIGFGYTLKDWGIFYENAISNKTLNMKVIISSGENNQISHSIEKIAQSSSMISLKSPVFSVKQILNKVEYGNEISKEKKSIFSLGTKRINYTFDGKDHYGYLNFEIKDLNFFIFNDSSLVIETSEYSDIERYWFERRIEDKNRVVPRIYDVKYESISDYLKDIFFTNKRLGFRLEFKSGKSPDLQTRINLKYLLGKTDFNKNHNLSLILKGFFIGYDFKREQIYAGFRNRKI